MSDPKYIDIHAHMNFSAYDEDRNAVIERALENDVWMINVGTKLRTSEHAIEIVDSYEKGVYAIIGLHPVHTTESFHDEGELGPEGKPFRSKGEIFDTEAFSALADHPKVVGIGETGLDYFRSNKDAVAVQRNAFEAQIQLAITHNLPLMLHVRPSEGSMDSYHDVYDMLSSYRSQFKQDLIANLHFFAGSTEVAQKFLDLGCTISFTGVITFARMYEKLVSYVPDDRIMAETDCPYVTPHPHRGERNEPMHVREVVRKIAKIRKTEESVMAGQLVQNAKEFFSLDSSSLLT